MGIPDDLAAEIELFLQKMPLFANIDGQSLKNLSNSGRIEHIQKAGVVFLQSDPPDEFYIVKTGLVSILLGSSDGREMVINEIRPGDYFGELGIITRNPRSTTAITRTDCTLLVFTRQAFTDILDTEPLLARRILVITAERLRRSSERESALAFLDAQARLARLLLQMDKVTYEKGYITISQEELAQRTGLTRQTVAKALGRWRRSGWLITGRGHILLLRHSELSNLETEWLST